MDFPLSQSGLLSLLTHLHEVAEDRQTALRGRLQHFQRLRFPPGVNTGRGKPAAYGAGSILSLSVAFEMLQLGMLPEAIVRLLTRYSGVLPAAAKYTGHLLLGDQTEVGTPDYYVITFDPAALSNLQGDSFGDNDRHFYMSLASLKGHFAREIHEEFWQTRLSIVNTTTLIFRISDYLYEHHRVSATDFSNALIWWAKKQEEIEILRISGAELQEDSGQIFLTGTPIENDDDLDP